jgi:hypothetical protein
MGDFSRLPTLAEVQATARAQQKSELEPGVISRRKRRAEESKALTEAYAEVDARDAGICQVTGRYTQPGAIDPRVRREHHHLRGRNVRPEWVTKAEHIVLVCAEAHQLITMGWIAVEGTDARKPLRFHWTDLCKGRRPFEIRARRGHE